MMYSNGEECMAQVYLSLGSNLGNRVGFLERAQAAFQKAFHQVRFSEIYETEPVDYLDQPWFLNQVVELGTELSPLELLNWSKTLENQMGRVYTFPKGPRTLDVDILTYDDIILNTPTLCVPHPRLAARKHVLVPLSELNPNLKIQTVGQTVSEVLETVKDSSRVYRYAQK